jgi:phosphoribosylformimino-5-aminoimidazole carboxamide ribotide isomerase
MDFVEAGAEWLHVIDVDGSLQNPFHNSELICEIIDAVDIPVQVGGGIRTQSDVDWWMERGAARVVLGTAAVLDRLFVTEVCTHFPGKIVISITGKDGRAMIDGWRTKTSFTPLQLAKSFENTGAAAIIYTDLDRFENGPEVGLASTIEIGTQLTIPMISTGTVYTLDDVSTLALLPNIEGAIIGRALYEGNLKLADAIKIAHDSWVAPDLAEDGIAPKMEEVSGIPIKDIDHVGVYSSDLDRSAKFYELLGFKRHEGGGSDKLQPLTLRHKSGVALNLVNQRATGVKSPPLVLEVNSLPRTRSFLEYNDIAIVDSYEHDGRTVLRLKDPDDNIIEFNHYQQ